MKRVLVVAYYFPPMGLSGVQRVSKLVKYLPEHGWHPTVLTVKPGGYFAYDETLLKEVETAGVHIVRTGSFDPTRAFGRGETVALPPEGRRKWLAWLSQLVFVPDNKIGWYPAAVIAGRRLLREDSFDTILSSAPPYTGHLIGAALSRVSGLPLVVDFRDDWVGNPRHVYPTSVHRLMHKLLERRVLKRSKLILTINEPIARSLGRGHRGAGSVPEVEIVPQGFDPADFEGAGNGRRDRLRILYSGVFYDAQTPDFFLRAVADLVERCPRLRLELVFVGLVPDSSRQLAVDLGLQDLIRYEGYLPHDETVRRLESADVLWMTVGRQTGEEGISTGKLFEYFGARKPILGLVPQGTAMKMLKRYDASYIAAPDDVVAISGELARLADAWRGGRLPSPDDAFVRSFDRRNIAGQVAALLDSVAAARA